MRVPTEYRASSTIIPTKCVVIVKQNCDSEYPLFPNSLKSYDIKGVALL